MIPLGSDTFGNDGYSNRSLSTRGIVENAYVQGLPGQVGKDNIENWYMCGYKYGYTEADRLVQIVNRALVVGASTYWQ